MFLESSTPPASPATMNNGMNVTMAKNDIPRKKETAEAEETVLILNMDSGRTGSAARLSTSMKRANSTGTLAKTAISCHEYHGKVDPPPRNPKLSNATQAVSNDMPVQSITGLWPGALDSRSPRRT